MRIQRTLWAALAALLAFAGCGHADAAPAQIIFLRHAEKPDRGPELNERGRERAAALVRLFTHDARAQERGPAVAIFAMRQARPGSSVRAIQTMEPTGRALGVALDTRFVRDEIARLVLAIQSAPGSDGKTVIVCWEHDAIPEMLKAFGWAGGPKNWPDKSYDRLWLLDFENGKPVRFRDVPQRLLPGDKAK